MRHLRLLQRESATCTLALPVRPERARELEGDGFQVVRSWRDARDRGATHAVIATATRRHAADTESALTAGCHVLVEKPMAVNAASARATAQVAVHESRGLWVGCCLRFQSALHRFVEQLPSLGSVHAVRIECQSYLPDWRPDRPYRESYSAHADEGGVLRDLIHEIDYAGWLFGWPSAVQARVRNLGRLGIESDEVADLLWETDSGIVVSIRLDYLSQPPHRRMRATGERGSLEWDAVTGMVTASLRGQPVRCDVFDPSLDDMYVQQARAFLGATPSHFDGRMATALDGIRALAICDAARLASDRRREAPVFYS